MNVIVLFRHNIAIIYIQIDFCLAEVFHHFFSAPIDINHGYKSTTKLMIFLCKWTSISLSQMSVNTNIFSNRLSEFSIDLSKHIIFLSLLILLKNMLIGLWNSRLWNNVLVVFALVWVTLSLTVWQRIAHTTCSKKTKINP